MTINFFSASFVRIGMVASALLAIVRLARVVLANRSSGNLAAALTGPASLRWTFTALRAFLPNLVLSKKLITAYDNTGTAVVTRFEDVHEVLNRDGDFAVVYEPKMRKITAGENFFLGMQETPRYTRDVSNMRLAMRREDIPIIVTPLVAARACELVAAADGRIDLPQDLTLRVPATIAADYFGTPGPSEPDMIAWTTAMFWYLFIDLKGDARITAAALDAATKCRDYLDAAVRDRKRQPAGADDTILSRCLTLQGAGLPGMDDLDIRNNLIGLLIGLIPTQSQAAVQALDQLLDCPDALAGAQAAAQADNDALLGKYVFEALRFNPVNPMIYRRAAATTVIARSTLRARTIPEGTMVLAANLSAMFDPLQVKDPNAFRTDRPAEDYILWGYGLHTCFGHHINQVVIPAMLKPLLKRKGLRRRPGPAGRIDTAGTPFPAHMMLEFDCG